MRCAACGDDMAGRTWRDVRDFEYGTYHPVDFLRCARCGTIRQSPPPDAATIPAFYPPDYRNHLIAEGGFFSLLKRAQTRWLASRISRHIDGTEKKVLEIGCGSGGLLIALRNLGFRDLAGADFDDTAAPLLAGRGIRFRSVNIEREVPFAERFDAVIMVNVIEHFLDPAGVFRRVRERLAPGGRIVLITPNAEAFELLVFGRFWAGFHAPRHLWLFSRHGLELMARAAGLGVTTIRPMADPGQWAISLQNLFQESRFLRIRLSHGLAWYTPILAAVLLPASWLGKAWPRRSATMLAVFSAEA